MSRNYTHRTWVWGETWVLPETIKRTRLLPEIKKKKGPTQAGSRLEECLPGHKQNARSRNPRAVGSLEPKAKSPQWSANKKKEKVHQQGNESVHTIRKVKPRAQGNPEKGLKRGHLTRGRKLRSMEEKKELFLRHKQRIRQHPEQRKRKGQTLLASNVA